MNSTEFVEAIKVYVRNAAVEDTKANLERPPGRRVPPDIKKRSIWYNQLPDADLEHVHSAISTAVHQALFGFFAVLDGARAIEDGPDKGRLELIYVGNQRVLLNDPNNPLHDLFNAAD
ncbi:MAG TPA: hypothetical protein VJT11_11405 [Nitrospiraceae bacterium]|nr:hypothetical protein [Nitrospiraceae bacterium]